MGRCQRELDRIVQPGDQIACVPNHADDDLHHPDVEFGFIVSMFQDDAAYCRYWSKNEKGDLRTKANSELTPLRLLRKYEYASNDEIARVIEKYGIQIG